MEWYQWIALLLLFVVGGGYVYWKFFMNQPQRGPAARGRAGASGGRGTARRGPSGRGTGRIVR